MLKIGNVFQRMDELPGHLLAQMVEIEAAAEDILTDKQQIIVLDRKRQQTREAQR